MSKCCPIVVDGPVVRAGGHPAWIVPRGGDFERSKLVVRNSLTDTKEPLIPSEGNIIRMYVCGPTVYSVSHMGHARTFLGFDILRRILEKYFRFNVLYQLNVTDIDDKIILTARKNELVRQFQAEGRSLADVQRLLNELIPKAEHKLMSEKSSLLEQQLSEGSREFTERETQLKHFDLKLEQLGSVKAATAAAVSAEELIQTGKDLIANAMDSEKGHLVSDKSIFESHSRYYEKEFLDDCTSLGIRAPDVLTRVTEYVPEIVNFVVQIEQNGFAYESAGSVYFDTQKFRESGFAYPKLVPQAGTSATEAEIAEGEGALSNQSSEKKHRNDFALWKKSKAGEPTWDSPWGPGRPGWHIECSVMATAIHGSRLDVHGGGVDLKFPHHDNEIAQSEAHFKIPQWTNFFLHAGHLHIKGLKMAKSLKNFITIRQALEKFSAKQIRIMFLLQQWDKPVNFSDQTLTEAREKENRLNSFFARIAQIGRNFPVGSSPQKWDALDQKLSVAILDSQERVHAAMCDNFDTPTAMDAIEACVTAVNNYLIEAATPKYPLLVRARDFVHNILSVWGVIDETGASAGSAKEEELANELVKLRDRLRQLAATTTNNALLQLSDELRDETFVHLGIKVVDSSGKGAESWSFVDPADLKREQEFKRQEKVERDFAKLDNKKQILLKEIAKLERLANSDRELLFPNALEVDAEGLPVGELSASKRKGLKKDLEKLKKERSDFEAKGAQAYLIKLKASLAEIDSKLDSTSI